MRKKGQRIVISAILLVLVFSLSIQPLCVLAVETDEGILTAAAAAVKIIKQPKSVAAPEGATATVTVEASGEGLTYQWYYKNTTNQAFHLTTDFTTNTYEVPMNEKRDGRQIYCVVTDKYGNTAKTDTVTLHMGNPATITKQPVSVVAPIGKTAKVTLSAKGDGLTYEWYYKSVGEKEFSLTTSFKSNTYSVSMTEARNGRQLYCVVTDQYGTSVKSNVVTIGVPDAVKITNQTANNVAPSGKEASVTVEAVGDGLTYQWYYKNTTNKAFHLTTDFTGNTYTVPMTSARNGRQIYCVVTDKYGNTAQSETFTLHMGNPATITKQPVSVLAPIGKTAKVTVSATGDGLTYQWYYKNAGQTKFYLTTSFTSNTYSVSMTQARNGRQIYCVITDKYGTSVKTDVVTLSVPDPVKLTQQPESVTVLFGQTATVTVQAEGDGLTYQWYYKNTTNKAFHLTTDFTGNTYSVPMTSARNGRQIYCVVTDKYGNTVKSEVVTIAGVNRLTIVEQPQSVKAEKGENVTVTVKVAGEGLSYKWYYKNAGQSKFYLTTKFTSNTYSVTMDDARNGRQLYCVITDKDGNTLKTQVVTIAIPVKAAITKQPETVIVLFGDEAKVTVGAVGDGLTYQWYYKEAKGSKYYLTKKFTGNTYSVSMTDERNGRQLYCVITDEYGNSVKSNVVTIIGVDQVTITKQPESVTVNKGEQATVKVEAVGEGLTYQWYYKNTTNKAFHLTTKFTTNTYSITMDDARDGRQVYCVITDKDGNTVKTVTVTLNMVHVHTMGEWVVMREPTPEAEGFKRSTCACGYYEDEPIAKVKAVRYITIDMGNGETVKIGVGSNGAYYLSDPYRIGYNFVGWKDSKGKTFASSGTVKANTKIYAQWELDGTDTLAELIERAGAGAEEILITANIVVNKPIYVPYETTIYSDGDFSIIRAPGYAGDIFVVGQDKNAVASVVQNHQAVLTLGGGKGTLTIDGNRDNLTVTVVGSAIYAADSCIVNLYDGIRIANHAKLGNERTYDYQDVIGEYTADRAGGAAILILDSTVNMYGGIIENNLVATEYTVVTNEDGTTSSLENFGCGGAIFNHGNFNMHGGTITSNEGLRGGGIYNGRIVYLHAGTISDNFAHVYGGALASSSSANADTHIGNDDGRGTMIIKNNHSLRAGGALYSNTNSPIVIYGNTQFIGNVSETSGGAIYTAGGLTIRGAEFIGNSATLYSGGAIYHHYTKAEFSRRHLTVSDCVFEENFSGLGGAICLSSSGTVVDEGTYATFTNCQFLNNKAVQTEANPGNGAAMYITRFSDATITGCDFTGNSAANNAGAIAIHSGATVDITGCTFTENTARFGGAVYTSSDAKVTFKNVDFEGNSAYMNENGSGGNGGALYIYGAVVTMDDVDMYNNAAANNAGALYLGSCDMTLDDSCEFVGNSAGGHGGAIYVTYKTLEDGTKDGTKLNITGITFKDNSALCGGAISARTASELNLTDVAFVGNSTPGAQVGTGNGGGAIYSNNSVIKADGVTFDGNSSGYYGGVIRADYCDTYIYNSTFTNNAGGTGGVIYAAKGTMTMDQVTVTGNTSTLNGVLYLTGTETTLTNITASGNDAVYGGVLYVNGGGHATLKDLTLTGNTGSSGAAVYVAGNSVVDVTDTEFTNNAARGHGGAIYVIGSTVNVGSGTTFTGNTSVYNGGAIAAYDKVDETTQQKTPSTVTITGIPFENNTGACGGAVYFNDTTYTITDCTFTGNTATSESYGGGAVYNTGATGTIDNVTFTNNTALRGGAMTLYTSSQVTVSNVTATGNTATAEGGVFYVNNCQLKLVPGKLVFTGNSANYGGAIYMHGKGLNLDLENAVLKDNTATTNGGAIQITGVTLNISGSDTVITGNTAGNYGGAIYAAYVTDAEGYKNGATLNITGVTLEGNKALHGGAISGRTNTTFNLTDVVFKNNSTPDANTENGGGGGAIYANNSVIHADNVIFDGNSSGYYGGAIKAEVCQVNLKNGTTLDGNSGGTGAALYLTSGSSLNASDLTVINNTSSANGVIYLNGSTFELTNLTAHDNSSKWNGGVLYINGGKTTVTITDSVLKNNTSGSGGTIYMAGGALTVSGSEISSNTANTGGAATAINGAQLNIVDSILEGNNATTGGAVSIQGAVLQISGATEFNDNTATGNGGAIHISDYFYKVNETDTTSVEVNASVTIMDAVFSGNTGSTGGAVYVSGNEYTISGAQFLNNTATATEYGGGAVYSTRSVGYLDNIVMTGNGSVKGGAVALHTESQMTITSMMATGNSAYVNAEGKLGVGGVFYVNNSTLNLNGTNGSIVLGTTESGNTAVTGGVVRADNNAKVNISGAVIVNNSASGNGGAVYALSSDVTLNDTTFEYNTTTSNGGAIYIAAANLSGANNIFTGNSATGHGGAIYGSYTGSGDARVGAAIDLVGGLFDSNTALAGGAVSVRSACSATFDSTVFANNAVTGYVDDNDGDGDGGGAIYMGFGSLELNNVTATGNTAEGFGGAITALGGTLDITGGSYTGNSAAGGGVINAMYDCAVTITGAELKENESTYVNSDYNNSIGGGAILISGGSLTVSDAYLMSNSTDYYGGAILASGTQLTIDQGTTITGSTGSTGAAVFIKNNSTAVLDHIYIYGNTAKSNGVVYINSSTVTMNEVSAYDNIANQGGVIFVSNGKSLVNVTNSVLTRNTAKNGGVIYADSATVTFTGCEIVSNTATSGGVSYSKLANITFDSCSINKNSATSGAVAYAEAGTVKLSGGLIEENSATNGGVVYAKGTAVTVDGANLRNNTVTQSGGAIYMSEGTLDIISGVFETNSATNHAGGIYCSRSTVTMSGATFIGNTAGSNGGAMYVSGSNVTGTDNCSFDGNSAGNHGGAVYVVYVTEKVNEVEEKIGTTLDLTNCSFTGNKALYGGAISGRTNSVITLTDVVLDGNDTLGANEENTAGGGAIYTNNTVLTLSGCVVSNNQSGYYGGAIKTDATQVILKDDTVLMGNSGGTGAALYLSSGSSLTATDLYVVDNISSTNGVLYLNGNDFTFVRLIASGNTADWNGGVMYVSSAKAVVTITDSTLAENISGNGGAIYLNNGTVNIVNSTFASNEAKNGGAIYQVKGTLNISENSILTDNVATADGGAIHSIAGTVTINGSHLNANTASAGGAISVINGVQLNLTDAVLDGNSAATGGAVNVEGAVLYVSGETSFIGNTSTGYGGAIFVYDYVYKENEEDTESITVKSSVTIDGAVFNGNSGSRGGALYVSSNEYSISNTEFLYNTATAAEYGGGAIYSTVAIGQLENVTLTGNSSVKGGAIALHSKSEMTVTSMTATGNIASANSEGKFGLGGVFYVNNSTLNLNGTNGSIVLGTVESGNTAVTGGAICAENGASVTVSGASMMNNHSTKHGGAMYASNTTLKLTDSTLESNTADSYGGAVHISGGSLELNNNTFTSNKAIGNGGAAYISMATSATLTGNTFTANESELNGGAIDIVGTTAILTDNVFAENKALGHGGAIYVVYGRITNADNTTTDIPAVLTITGGSFEKNTALAGGAVSIRSGCDVTFDGTSFTQNSVTGYAGENDGDGDGGGAIYVGFGKVTLNNVIATGNSAESYGGFLDAYYGTVNITGGSYTSNTAAIGGGAIYAVEGCTVTIADAAFTQNFTTDTTVNNHVGGGAISINDGTLTISGSTFDGNASEYYGGTLLAGESTVTINDSTVTGSVGSTGAALYFKNSCKAVLEGVELVDNPGKGNGMIYTNSGSLTMTDVTASGNTSYNGGVLYISGGSTVVTITDSSFVGNTATNAGGAIYLANGKVTITGGELKQNTSKLGGAIYNNKGTLEITGVTFTENEANGTDANGGAIALQGGSLTASGENAFNGNTADNLGGAVYVADFVNTDATITAATMTMTDGTFGGNSAAQGGAVYTESGEVTFTGTQFTENTATNGGAIAAINDAQLNLVGAVLENNSATTGGAVFVMGAALDVSGNSTFAENTATGNGGAVYVNDYVYKENEEDTESVTVKASLTINGADFTGNSAGRGGALYVGKNEYTLKDTSFVSNTATEQSYGGGAIYSSEAIGQLENVTLTDNSSVKGGAVALHTKSEMTVTSMTATGNSAFANSEGKLGVGGVFFVNNSTLNLNGTNGSIVLGTVESGNTAVTGGAIYAENLAVVNISGAEFTGNSASSNGGAILAGPVSVTLNDSVLKNNHADVNGGAISLSGTTLTGANNNFISNSAVGHGGAIYNAYSGSADSRISGVVNFTGGSFENNTAMAGGAISIRTACEATFDGTEFIGNSVTGYADKNDGDGDGGGVIYVGFGSVTLNNVTATGNTAETYGGVIDAYNGTVTINGGSYDENSATYGGVIYVLKESTVTMTDVELKNNSVTKKGGALCTGTSSPNLVINSTNCVFSGNSSGEGGGAVEIQNGNCNSTEDPTVVTIVFKDCTFTKNTAGTTGAAIEIRTNSCAKIDGITATDNKATDNGGVVYVTSNYSRLYLTGTVTISGNTAKSGNFIYLYNNNYSNPPKLYTTDSSSAAWYSEVKGNRTNVAFDLTTLP